MVPPQFILERALYLLRATETTQQLCHITQACLDKMSEKTGLRGF